MDDHGLGHVYRASDTVSGQDVAVKLEYLDVLENQLETEEEVYQTLHGERGFPKVHWFGQDEDHNILVMDLLGPSLEELFKLCGKRFGVATTLNIGLQAVRTAD